MALGISYTFWIFFILLGIIFFYFPGVDIWFSSLFFKEGSFYLKDQFLIRFIYDATHPLLGLFFFAALGMLVYSMASGKTLYNIRRRALVFILLSVIMAPGVVVNAVLKDNVDRARPKNIVQFGGDRQFTPAFVLSDQCEKNCSFVCGHASAGFSFIALALVFTGSLRKKIFYTAVAGGFLIGLVRIIQGGHFLSDVIFSFLFTYLTIRLLYYVMVERFTRLYDESL